MKRFSSEEKRKTIEDLIGLSYFDDKKAESIKQLDDADRRLEIALAKMGEIKKRIDELEEERNQKLRHDILERELNRYKAIDAANKMRVVSSKKDSIESTLHATTTEITQFDGEKSVLGTEIGVLDTEKAKSMSEANDYNQAKATIDSELSELVQKSELEKNEISIFNLLYPHK